MHIQPLNSEKHFENKKIDIKETGSLSYPTWSGSQYAKFVAKCNDKKPPLTFTVPLRGWATLILRQIQHQTQYLRNLLL